jgi:3-methyladenine DNA glycosylase AlkD
VESWGGERRVAGAPPPQGRGEAEAQNQDESHSEIQGRSSEEGEAAKAEARPIGALTIMTLSETLKQLKALGTAKVRAQNAKSGAGDNQFGVSLGDIRTLAKKIRTNHELGLSLWENGNVDAQFLATLLIQPKRLSAKEMDRMVRSISFVRVADWLIAYVVRQHADKEALRRDWMAADDRWAARAGWDLTSERVAKSPDGLDLPALLARIESEMAGAAPEVQWTMNNTLAAIGIHFPKHRKRALAIGEKIGLYRDWPVSKGCVIPFAPIWINHMVNRQAK